MKTVTLSICCHSEAQDATVGFGVSFDADKANIYTIGTEWVSEGMLESFWENHFEFEDSL